MIDLSPRYLIPFQPKQVAHSFVDVLIVGSGIAGLRAALAIDQRLSVLVVTKGQLAQSNSNMAQGGIAGVLDAGDCFEDHVADTLTAGGSLCHRDVVESVVREAPGRIQELIDWGTEFDREAGEILLGREGGHNRRRIAHARGDATGAEIMRATIARVKKHKNVRIWENTFTLDLLTHDGACRGALLYNSRYLETLVWAKQTILASGGAGQIYRESTNQIGATGDGHAMAYRAGAELRDMEFMQFHPTVLYIAGSSRSLITEAVRGEGAKLVDQHGNRFMDDYDSRSELAPRDVVSQAIVTQMEKTRHPNVYLDMSHLDASKVRARFPGIAATCSKFGIDITTDLIPVRPGAHYMLGGLTTDSIGQTSLPGLWGAGESTSTGLHGANRLASNSLLEGLVYGARAGENAAQAARDMPDDLRALPVTNSPLEKPLETIDPADIRNSLQSLMWRNNSVRRSREGLEEARETVARWCRYVFATQFTSSGGWELQNMLLTAQIMVEAALARTESRGVHLRSDFPATDDAWNRQLTFVRKPADGC